MDPLPSYVESWVRKATGERHYLCRLCGGPNDDHGPEVFFRRHLQTLFHQNKVRQMESLHCTICDIRFDFNSKYQRHLESKAHKQKENPALKPVFKCDACSIGFRSRAEEVRHLATAKHTKNTAKRPPVFLPSSTPA